MISIKNVMPSSLDPFRVRARAFPETKPTCHVRVSRSELPSARRVGGDNTVEAVVWVSRPIAGPRGRGSTMGAEGRAGDHGGSPSRARDHLANERTFLAWVRTALGLLGLGFVLARMGLFLEQLALTSLPGSHH